MTRSDVAAGRPALTSWLGQDFAKNPKRYDRVTLVVLRLGQWTRSCARWHPLRIAYKVLDLVWIRCALSADIPADVVVGRGIRLPHGGRGVVLHPNVCLGSDVTLYHNVTMGMRDGDQSAVPRVEDGGFIGVGAILLGRVTVGRRARVGAGAVVLRDVPEGHTAFGVPAITRPFAPSS